MTINTIKNKERTPEILLVEDSYGDVFLTKKAFSGRMKVNITVAKDGEEAMAILRREAKHADAPVPDIILLDLNLPKKDGKTVLKEVKSDDLLKVIPVIILTSSLAEQDVVRSYGLHANGYIIKPVTIEKFSEVAKSIEDFWFNITILPDQKDVEGFSG